MTPEPLHDSEDPKIDYDIEDTPEVEHTDMSWRHRPNAEDYGVCRNCEMKFHDKDEYDDHKRRKHPVRCSDWNCDRASRYKTQGSPHSWCPRHADKLLSPSLAVYRVNREAEMNLPTLPDNHPIEEVVTGLYGEVQP